MPRTYARGRSTAGWRRGEPITRIDQVKVGDVLIGVSHQFQAENLYQVVPHPPFPVNDHFYVQYSTPDLQLIEPICVQCVWDFMLDGSWGREWFRAVRELKKG